MMASTDQPFNGGKGSPGFPEAQKSLDGDESFRIVISRSGAQVKEVVPEGKAGCGRGITFSRTGSKVHDRLRRLDKDNDGEIGIEELTGAVEELLQQEAQNRLLWKLLIGLVIAMVLMMGAVTGMTYGIVKLAQPTRVEHDQFLVTRAGMPALTGGALLDLTSGKVSPSDAAFVMADHPLLTARPDVDPSMITDTNTGLALTYLATLPTDMVNTACQFLNQGLNSFAAQDFGVYRSTKYSTLTVTHHMGCDGGAADLNNLTASVTQTFSDNSVLRVEVLCKNGTCVSWYNQMFNRNPYQLAMAPDVVAALIGYNPNTTSANTTSNSTTDSGRRLLTIPKVTVPNPRDLIPGPYTPTGYNPQNMDKCSQLGTIILNQAVNAADLVNQVGTAQDLALTSAQVAANQAGLAGKPAAVTAAQNIVQNVQNAANNVPVSCCWVCVAGYIIDGHCGCKSLGAIAADVGKAVVGAGVGIGNTAVNAANGVANGAVTAANAAGNALNTANNAINNAVNTTANAINSAVNTAVNAAGNAATTAGNAVGNAANTAVNAAGNAANAAGNAVGNAANTAVNAAGNAASAAGGAITGAAGAVGGAVTSCLGSTITGAITGAAGQAVTAVTGAVGTAVNGATGAVTTAGSAVTGVINTAVGALPVVNPSAILPPGGLPNPAAVANIFTSGANTAASAAGGAVNTVANGAVAAGNAVASGATSAVNTVANGATDAANAAVNTASNIGSSIVSAFTPPDDCFPSAATVEVLGRGLVTMEELKYGDKVAAVDHATGQRVFREVYLFGHKDATTMGQYFNLVTASGATLQLSSQHYIATCVDKCDTTAGTSPVMKYKYGRDVVVGDLVHVVAADSAGPQLSVVQEVTRSMERGLFNPYIRGADIIVDGVVASSHSDWILDDVTPAAWRHMLPAIYDVLLYPIYLFVSAVGPVNAEWVAHSGLGLAERSSTANTVATSSVYVVPGYTIITGLVIGVMSCPALVAANAVKLANYMYLKRA